MTISIVPYQPEAESQVSLLNARLRAQNVPHEFPERAVPEWLPRVDGDPMYHEFFLAFDDDTVRGGYILKHQDFLVQQQPASVGFFRLPLSEGFYDKRYAALAAQFMVHALKKNPLLFSLGIGSREEPLAKMEAAVGWTQTMLPFQFRIQHAFRFLRNIRHLRRRPLRRFMLDAIAWSGLGFLSLQAARLYLRLTRGAAQAVPKYEEVDSFGPWADDVWNAAHGDYSLIAVRTQATLNRLFPLEDPRYHRLRVIAGDQTIGWAVVLNSQLESHKHFGNMRLGSIVDFLCLKGHAEQVIAAATDYLVRGDVDLLVCNASHHEWSAALHRQAFLTGPSNFMLSASKKLMERLQPFTATQSRLHLTRGDGNGPIHL